MSDVEQFLAAIFGTIVTLAIISVIVGQKSKAPAVIQDFGTALSNVVAAAVNPVSANYGYGNGNSTFSTPSSSSSPLNLPNLGPSQIFGSPMSGSLYNSPL